MASYKRICDKFGIDPLRDFCFTHGANHGPGKRKMLIQGSANSAMKAGKRSKET